MPHITIEYSANMEGRADMIALARNIHEAARATGLFERGFGIRTRLAPREGYVIADGDPENAFVAVMLRIAAGRSESDRLRLSEAVFAAACSDLAHAIAETNFALTLELQEVHAFGAQNLNNLHERLARKYDAAVTD